MGDDITAVSVDAGHIIGVVLVTVFFVQVATGLIQFPLLQVALYVQVYPDLVFTTVAVVPLGVVFQLPLHPSPHKAGPQAAQDVLSGVSDDPDTATVITGEVRI